MARRLSIVQMDVFSDKVIEGNSLAVFLDGRALSTDEMQAIARETNLSETTFILPRDTATEKERGVDGSNGVAQFEERVLIEQGMEMNRPSRIFVRGSKQDNRVINVRVGGYAVEIMRGEYVV